MARQDSAAPTSTPLDQNERERLHKIIEECNALIDPERYPELSAEIDSVLTPCDEAGHCMASPASANGQVQAASSPTVATPDGQTKKSTDA